MAQTGQLLFSSGNGGFHQLRLGFQLIQSITDLDLSENKADRGDRARMAEWPFRGAA